MESTDNQLIAIETKIAYLEDFIHKLQETVLVQNEDLERIKNENRSFRSKLGEITDALQDIPDARPPHY